jgi:uncharacterized membrane protein HdeD (DUF308 family)
MRQGSVPLVIWPFKALWEMLDIIIRLTGRLVALILGVLLMIVGAVLSITIVGATVGIPLVLFGFILVMRGFF